MADPREFRVGDMVYRSNDDEHPPWVVNWGPANTEFLSMTGNHRTQLVPAWKLLSVQFWYRYPRHTPWYTGEQWTFGDYFWCKDWAQIPVIFNHYWATGGQYERVAYCVEAYDWTWEDGLMTEDHV